MPLVGVVASLNRLGVRVEAPLPDPARATAPGPAGEGRSPGLTELFATGVLRAPVKLLGTYKGRQVEATGHSDGTIEVDGQRYPSLSTAAKAAVRVAGGPERQSINGWEFWRVADRSPKGGPLAELRGHITRDHPTG